MKTLSPADKIAWEDVKPSPVWARMVDPFAAWLMRPAAPFVAIGAAQCAVGVLLTTGMLNLDPLNRFIGLGTFFVAFGLPLASSIYMFNLLNDWARHYCRSPLFRSKTRISDFKELEVILKDHPGMIDQVARWATMNEGYLHMRHLWRLRVLYGALNWRAYSCIVSPISKLPTYDPMSALEGVLDGAILVSMQAQILERKTMSATGLAKLRRL